MTNDFGGNIANNITKNAHHEEEKIDPTTNLPLQNNADPPWFYEGDDIIDKSKQCVTGSPPKIHKSERLPCSGYFKLTDSQVNIKEEDLQEWPESAMETQRPYTLYKSFKPGVDLLTRMLPRGPGSTKRESMYTKNRPLRRPAP